MPRGNHISGPLNHARACRLVWQAVSVAPGMPIRQLARTTGLAVSTASRTLHTLRDVYGYIAFEHDAVNARAVLVPFIAITRTQ